MKKYFLFTSILFFSAVSFAGFMFEPYVMYLTAKTKTQLLPAFGGDAGETNDKGAAAGLRIGYRWGIPYVAFDTRFYGGNDDQSPSSNLTLTDLGATVGGSFRRLNYYAGYIFSVKQVVENSNGGDTTFTGTGYKLGLGFQMRPRLSLNLEHTIYDMTDIENQMGKSAISETFSEFEYSSTGIGLAFTY